MNTTILWPAGQAATQFYHCNFTSVFLGLGRMILVLNYTRHWVHGQLPGCRDVADFWSSVLPVIILTRSCRPCTSGLPASTSPAFLQPQSRWGVGQDWQSFLKQDVYNLRHRVTNLETFITEGKNPETFMERWLTTTFGASTFSPLFAIERAHRVPLHPYRQVHPLGQYSSKCYITVTKRRY